MMKKGDYVRVEFFLLAKVIRVNKNKGIVFVDLGEGRVHRYRLDKVELVGE